MSSCFNGDGHARQLRSQLRAMVATLAMLASGAAYAQSVESVDSAETYVTGPAMQRTTLGTTPLRLGHRTEGFGQEASETAIGGRGAVDLAGAVGFVDGQFRISNESRFGTNVGGGIRWYSDDYLTGSQRILGVSGWYDGQETVLNNYFNQGGVSFESLGEFIDFRVNANIPFEDEKTGDQTFISGELNFIGNSLGQATIVPTDVALRVVDAEAAVRVYDLNAWVYGGGYQMDGNGVSDAGAKVGARGYITNDLVIDIGVTDDDVFGTNTVFQVMWMPGRTGAGPTSWIHTLADRMREPVYRNAYIATRQVETQGSIALTGADGQVLSFVHVDSNEGPGDGDGTFENPYRRIDDVNGDGSDQGDIILVHGGSSYSGQTAEIRNEQRFLGEGDNNPHTVVTQQLGTIAIPETAPGALAGPRPLITNNITTESILLSSTMADAATFSPIEVSNFRFDGGNSAIDTTTGVGAVNINRLVIANTGNAADADGNAINLTPITETLASGSRLRFSPTIDDVRFTNVAGDDIRLDSGPAPPAATTIVESIVVSDIISEGGNGVGINLLNTRRTATISNITWDGNATGDGAIRVANAGTQANIVVNGTNTIREGQTGTPDTTGFAIALIDSAGAMSVTGTTVTNTGGDSIIINDGAINLTFTGRIDQANTSGNAATSVVSVLGGHTGTVNFNELTANAGVIGATGGDGIQFADADGTYRFNDTVTLNGGNAGIDVLAGADATDGSEGTFAFDDADITNPTGTAVNIVGNRLTAFTISGEINTNSASGRPVAIEDNTDGDITVRSVINSTGQGILVQNNTNAIILFDGQTTINTTSNAVAATNTGVLLNNNATGSIRFNAIDITTASGNGFVATDTDSLTVAGADNTITTGTGVGLNLTDVVVGTTGVTFESVAVANGAANGITLNNVTGGLVTITGTGTTDDSGGTIVSAGDSISITNAARVSINNMNLRSTGVVAGSQAVDFNVTNANQSRLLLANNNITISDAAAGEGVLLNIASGANRADITLNDNVIDNTGGSEGLRLQTDTGASLKTINLAARNNVISTNSAAAADRAANFRVDGGAVLNATVLNNTFNNTGAGSAFEMVTLNAGSQAHLSLNANTGNATATDFLLTETAGVFEVDELADVTTRNTGTFTISPGITDETDAIPLPQLP